MTHTMIIERVRVAKNVSHTSVLITSRFSSKSAPFNLSINTSNAATQKYETDITFVRRRTRTTPLPLVPRRYVREREREKGMAMFSRVVPRRHGFSYCHAVTRGKNAIVGVAPRDAITGGIRGTRGLMPTIPTHAADTPCLCTKTTPLSPRWKEARLKFQPDTRPPPPPPLPKSVCLREMLCTYPRLPVVGSIDGTIISGQRTPVLARECLSVLWTKLTR